MLRLSARWVIPIAAPPITDGAVLVDGRGVITAVGPDTHVPVPDSARHIDLGEAALMPGLVNVHAHPELTTYRGLLEDLAFPDWITALRQASRAATPEIAGIAARWTCIEAIRAGITTIAATEASGASLPAFAAAGIRGTVYREVFGPDPAIARQALSELDRNIEEMLACATDLVRVGVSPHAPFSVSDELFAATAAYARERRLPVAVHTAESADEQMLVTAGTGIFAERLRARGITVRARGRSTVELLERTGVLEARPLLIHCVRVDAADVARIAATGASVAHCPAANARLGHGMAPLDVLLRNDVNVGLGSDSVASNNRMDILEEARLAQLFGRARLKDAAFLSPAAALELATRGGARALGLDSVVGSLVPGMDADLCAVALAGAHVQPVHDPVAAVVLAARASDVVLTMVRGRILHGPDRDIAADLEPLRPLLDDAALALHAARFS